MTDTGGAHRLLRERGREELLDLLLVNRLATGRDRARRLAAGVQRVLALVVLRLVGRSEDAGRDVCPGTVVEGLLLAPEKVGVGVLVEVRGDLQEIRSQRRRLLEAHDGNIPGRTGTARFARAG